ncbi:hypothetical protein LU11_gp189 [Pseudomonas phage Lu11]|uniref:hypothetical protein n=1 Tax=Pseudomonas phage Lu11 TaxID=1161927 RepID=UPI00025F17E3|nr:hypothetical protein LU11_gp189 [Pseudomonas phage Lu11]AFH14720.1 hypothetical protein Lu11_0183 [Pseudomonas phage Lu11]
MANQIDLTQYKWFQYDENAAELEFGEPRHNEEYLLALHPGNVYGVKKRAHGIIVVHKNSPDITFHLNEQEYNRIVSHSRGWSGKVKRVAVQAGVGGYDKPKDVLPPGWFEIELDSSNLNTTIYDSKNKILYVAFHNGASWAYENVSMKEFREMEAMESRGKYFNWRIKYVKRQYKIGNNFDKPPYDTAPIGDALTPKMPKSGPPPEFAGPPDRPVPKKDKAPAKQKFVIPAGMKVNPKAKIDITHSAHPGKSTTKSWSGVGFEWLGAKNPELDRILGELYKNGKAEVDDGKGIATLVLKDKILVPEKEEPAKPRSSAVQVMDVSGATEEKPGAAKRTVRIPKSAFETWLDVEQKMATGGKDGDAFKIIRRQRVDSEADIFKLLGSLRTSTLARDHKQAFRTAVESIVSLADQYPFTAKGKTTYKTLRKHVIAMGKA